MSTVSTNVAVTYFGKIPSRGDFVKSGNSHSLVTSLDNWAARAMDHMSEDLRWKNIFDGVPPFDFAFLGNKNSLAIAGHFMASKDSAQRRFPFVAAAAMEVGDADVFIQRCPMALARVWNRLGQFADAAVRSTDMNTDLGALAGASMDVDLSNRAYEATITNFLELQTIASLQSHLAEAGFQGSLRQLLLALGLLLQPVMSSGTNRLEKGIGLPLPKDPMYQHLTACFWLMLINPFLQRADFELTVYLTHSYTQQPMLVVGFDGASSATLESVLNFSVTAQEDIICFEEADWVEESVASEYGVAKLSSYLEQPRLSLAAVKKNFYEVFLGC